MEALTHEDYKQQQKESLNQRVAELGAEHAEKVNEARLGRRKRIIGNALTALAFFGIPTAADTTGEKPTIATSAETIIAVTAASVVAKNGKDKQQKANEDASRTHQQATSLTTPADYRNTSASLQPWLAEAMTPEQRHDVAQAVVKHGDQADIAQLPLLVDPEITGKK
jgi:hypothetical protein